MRIGMIVAGIVTVKVLMKARSMRSLDRTSR
jgi:hypothetical protein